MTCGVDPAVSWLVRIEAVNLDRFIQDTDDLSTIRGAGLLLLNAGKFLCGEPDGEKQVAGLLRLDGEGFVPETGSDLEGVDVRLRRVSQGASVTLFSFDADAATAEQVRTGIAEWLCKHPQLRPATFAVELAPLDHDFARAMTAAENQVRLAQMRAPNVSFGAIATPENAVSKSFCDIDHQRTRRVDLKTQPAYAEGSSYAAATDKDYASDATHQRRRYGRYTKVRVYQMIARSRMAFEPAWEFEEIARRGKWRTAFEHQPTGNALAYEVLESFDHLGRDYAEARKALGLPQMTRSADAILTADQSKTLVAHLTRLKHGPGPKLPLGRLHQIIRTLRLAGSTEEQAKERLEKIIKRIADTSQTDSRTLNESVLGPGRRLWAAKWFHLMELWDYAGYLPLDEAQS